MFIRFVTGLIHPSSGAREGLFVIAYRLRDDDWLDPQEIDRLNALLEWFDANLREPSRFSRSRRVHADSQGISWFKPTAYKHIRKARELSLLVREHCSDVSMIKTRRPGMILYEDQVQIVALPWNETGA